MRFAPALAMALLLALGLWLVTQPYLERRALQTPGATPVTVIVSGDKIAIEQRPAARVANDLGEAGGGDGMGGGEFEYRFLERDAGWLDENAFAREIDRRGAAGRDRSPVVRYLLSVLNVSSAWNAAWIVAGIVGQGCFFLRMLVQWVSSERERRSHVPEAFWWLSLAGGGLLFSYFVWRVDVVGVLGQSTGVVIYARNLWLIRSHRRASTPEA